MWANVFTDALVAGVLGFREATGHDPLNSEVLMSKIIENARAKSTSAGIAMLDGVIEAGSLTTRQTDAAALNPGHPGKGDRFDEGEPF